VIGVAVVDDDVAGSAFFIFQRQLSGLPACEFGLVPAALGQDAGEALLAWCVDEDDLVALAVEARLDEQRRVDDEQARVLGAGVLHLMPALLVDHRVDEFFELAALGWFGEDELGDLGAVDLAGLVEDALAPPLDEFLSHGRVGEQFACGAVRVGDDRAVCGQGVGDGGLARADATGEADDQHGQAWDHLP